MIASFLRVALCSLLTAGIHTSAVAADPPQRVISLGGSVTEIVYELGKGHALVATDMSSVHPAQATALPQVGYYRNLSLEGLVSMQPDLILASEQAGPPDILQRIRSLGIALETVDDNGTLTGLYSRIRQIAAALKVPEQGDALAETIRTDIEQAIADARTSRSQDEPVSAIMLLKRTAQAQAAGAGSTADALLALAGLENVMGRQQGYKPVSAEALAALQPELIITTTSSLDALGGKQALLSDPGIRLTPAAKHEQILILDDMLILGLGPRTARAIRTLAQARDRAMAARPDPQDAAQPRNQN